MKFDQQNIFEEWRRECLELNAERFKATVGRELLRELVRRWQEAYGDVQLLREIREKVVAVLSIKSTRPELRSKYKGWTDRLEKELIDQIEARSQNSLKLAGFANHLLNWAMFVDFCPLKEAWVRAKFTHEVVDRLTKHNASVAQLSRKPPRPVTNEDIEWELVTYFVRVHQRWTPLSEEYENFLFSDAYAEPTEQWLLEFNSKPEPTEIPFWYQVCREQFPQLFRVYCDLKETDNEPS
ncbi:MAG: hypothetical protein AB7N80_14155 [Bdellovibrionales bacterium]